MRLRAILASLALALTSLGAQAETIRVAIGTQDTTINCAAGGLLIRELGLLEKYLPRDGRYKDADYRVEWKNFTSGAPLTNEMVAGKLDFGAMADFSRHLQRRGLRRRRQAQPVHQRAVRQHPWQRQRHRGTRAARRCSRWPN